ncbi:uncharacterized protein DUF1599 [Breznakibacter xylanolyticus]|uniref:Uncharacterized protein DUF1599 n=1 Tax=Breznakibacter xylanolyticus TaxID=990 RepID=A0A2W7MXT7_9BACT|nr:DUF1599 domain-containing protein [Breznakibacter xylanolyticus]MBN2744406.1 DUF1599 domain-containing protein [Marinilabiliaceae bacterium]PZX12975.1 uncharacterized protein DUF1599 [Breznakibacter xylanolyticus]
MSQQTAQQFDHVIGLCKDIFEKKMTDYGTAWRILRPSSMTDQIFIKAQRIRSIEIKGSSRINEGIRDEFIGIVNYAAMALIQLQMGIADQPEMDPQKALTMYLEQLYTAKALMDDKNHDYDEAWRKMRISSFTDLILMKLHRTKQIEDNQGKTLISEGIDANYKDMINYAIFALIKLEFPEPTK